jgi:hypothetical protein
MNVTQNEEYADGLALVLLELEPREQVVWAGRPASVGPVVLQSVPKAIMGLVFMIFLVFWMVMVIRGGNNGWEKGRAVPPFAPHNVLIATIAGLWMMPFCVYLLLGPVRVWRRLNRTCYFLTDRRAFIVAPDFLGRRKTRSFPANALRLMRVEERSDGAGDLIFGNPSNWTGMAETVGFLGIDKPSDIEDLIRKTLFTAEPQESPLAALVAGQADQPAVIQKSYWLSLGIRLFQFVFLAAGSLVGLCILGDVILVCALVTIGPDRLFGARPPGLRSFSIAEMATAVAAGLGSFFMGMVVCGMFLHFALRIPIEIIIDDDHSVCFRGRLRTVTIPVRDILAIQTGQWFDPNRFQLDVVHKGGKLTMINQFSEFPDFLATVKELNPSIEIKGF